MTPRLQMQEVLREDLVVIAAADAAGAPDATSARSATTSDSVSVASLGDTITLPEVARGPQVVFHHGYDLREATSAAFEAAGLTPDVVVEGVEMDAAIRFVERGLGIAIVPAMVLVDRPRLRSVRLVDPGLSRTVSLAQRADVRPTAAASAMERTVLSTARALASADSELSRYVRLEG